MNSIIGESETINGNTETIISESETIDGKTETTAGKTDHNTYIRSVIDYLCVNLNKKIYIVKNVYNNPTLDYRHVIVNVDAGDEKKLSITVAKYDSNIWNSITILKTTNIVISSQSQYSVPLLTTINIDNDNKLNFIIMAIDDSKNNDFLIIGFSNEERVHLVEVRHLEEMRTSLLYGYYKEYGCNYDNKIILNSWTYEMFAHIIKSFENPMYFLDYDYDMKNNIINSADSIGLINPILFYRNKILEKKFQTKKLADMNSFNEFLTKSGEFFFFKKSDDYFMYKSMLSSNSEIIPIQLITIDYEIYNINICEGIPIFHKRYCSDVDNLHIKSKGNINHLRHKIILDIFANFNSMYNDDNFLHVLNNKIKNENIFYNNLNELPKDKISLLFGLFSQYGIKSINEVSEDPKIEESMREDYEYEESEYKESKMNILMLIFNHVNKCNYFYNLDEYNFIKYLSKIHKMYFHNYQGLIDDFYYNVEKCSNDKISIDLEIAYNIKNQEFMYDLSDTKIKIYNNIDKLIIQIEKINLSSQKYIKKNSYQDDNMYSHKIKSYVGFFHI